MLLTRLAKHTSIFKLSLVLIITALVLGCGSSEFKAPDETVSLSPRDDGTQIQNSFRVNYAGYLPLQEKVAVYINSATSARSWVLKNSEGNAVAKGESSNRRENDFASGDSFHLIDFSSFTQKGSGYYLSIDGHNSEPFDISNDPYGDLKYEFFDYFKDHERSGDIFNRSVDNWTRHSFSTDFIADAGDQGYYTVNAAEAQWSLINLLETFPAINEYYHQHSSSMNKVYDELAFFNSPMHKVIFPGEKLAVAKLATYSNKTYATCNGASDNSGACISRPETKATYAVARTLAAMARLHEEYGTKEDKLNDYGMAKKALINAETTPFVCLTWKGFGGEGGYYPNNDNFSLWREPRTHRDPCATGTKADPKDNNVNDDHYAALVELYITADQFGFSDDAKHFKQKVEAHAHHNRVDQFFFGAVSTEATLSLLTHRPKGLDLSGAEKNLFAYSKQVLGYQDVGYPGVTFNAKSDDWNSDDNDASDNNFRWASNRMQLNDARILMAAAGLSFNRGDVSDAIDYTNGVLRVLDQISGTNAVALAMYTSASYPFIEKAVTRTHDKLVADTESGKMVLGPNNWTNSNDPDMPAFGSLPGMKMFAMTGTGWSSREIAIDGNASLVPVVYFATEIAPNILAAKQALACPTNANTAPSGIINAVRVKGTRAEEGLYEGPVWMNGSVYFSHFTFGEGFPSRVMRFTPPAQLDVVINDSGSNGLTSDHKGGLFAGTHKYKAISHFDLSRNSRHLIAEKYNRNVFNSPNDLVFTKTGVLYFTDPAYQKSAAPGGQEMTRVYRVEGGVVSVVDDTISNPNGITLSPDESILYVSGGGEDGFVRAYDIVNNVPGVGKNLVSPVVVPDGMTVDCQGNIYMAEHTLQRIRVVSPEGKPLATIKVDANITNVVFGGDDLSTLYITGAGTLWSVPLNIAGVHKLQR